MAYLTVVRWVPYGGGSNYYSLMTPFRSRKFSNLKMYVDGVKIDQYFLTSQTLAPERVAFSSWFHICGEAGGEVHLVLVCVVLCRCCV